eukprot:99074_1
MSLYSLEIVAIGVESFKYAHITMISNIRHVNIYGTGNGGIRDAIIQFNTISNDLICIDDGIIGFGFYNSHIEVINSINGSVYLQDNSVTSGEAFTSSELIIGTVYGNVEIYDSPYGYSYPLWLCNINYVFGNILFSAAIDNGRQAFDVSIFNIGTVQGNVTFYSNTYGAFSESIITIDNVYNTILFIGRASGKYDYYSTDFIINNAKKVIFDVNTGYSLMLGNNVFGSGVLQVEIIADSSGGIGPILESSKWDCRNCGSFIINCLNSADCGGAVQIWCPLLANNNNNNC